MERPTFYAHLAQRRNTKMDNPGHVRGVKVKKVICPNCGQVQPITMIEKIECFICGFVAKNPYWEKREKIKAIEFEKFEDE